MATIGYAGALGGMAKDAAIGAGKGFLGGLKGAMISEAPGIAGAYAFGKDLHKRANAPKMPSGGSAPPTNRPSSSSSVAGGLGTTNDKSIVGSLRQSNIINLEQVRQLKQLNDNVITQSRLLKFTVDDTKRKDQFAEEVAKEQAIRDDALLQAIKRIGTGGSTGKQSSNDSKGGPNSLLGKIGDFISDNIGTLIGGYFGYKGVKAAGQVLGGMGRRGVGTAIAGRAVPQIGMAGRAAASNIIDVQARVISSSAARGALAEGVATIVPMVLRFLTGPVGLGIMAAAGAGAYLYSKRDPDKAAAASADSALKKLKNQPSETEGQFAKAPLKQDEAKVLLEQRAEREKVAAAAEKAAAEMEKSDTATKQQKETAKKYAQGRREAVDYDIKPWGGLDRVQRVAAGQPDPGGAISTAKYLDKVRGAESGGKNIQNQAGGSAGGVYQIVDSTWRETVTQMIKSGDKRFTEADLDPGKPGSNVGKFNEAKARMVAEYITEKNRGGLQNKLGRNPTETDLYMAYFMGMGDDNSGAIRFLKEMDKDPAQVAWKLSSTNPDSDIINNNAEVFFEKVVRDPATKSAKYPSGEVKSKEGPRSVKALYDLMNRRISGAAPTEPGKPAAAAGNAAVVASKKPEEPSKRPEVNIIKSSANSNAGPLAEEYKENDAKIEKIKSNSVVKDRILTSLSGKSSEQLTVLRKQVENITLDPSDKSEVLNAIDEEIKKKTLPAVIPKTSSSAYDQILAAFSAPFDSTKYDPGVQYASLDTGTRSDAGGGGGSNFEVKKEVVQTNDANTQEKLDVIATGLGVSTVTGQAKVTSTGYQGNPLLSKAFKPLFKSNSDILQDANKTFLKELRGTFTNIFNTGLTKALFPKGVGVSAAEAGRDDMYRGQQLQSIFGTNDKINEATTKLLGKQYGPMFAPLFNNLAQGYLEVGSRMAGKAIFQGIGDLGAKETMTLTGQVLGNYAAGNKKLAFEQLLYGASGGAKSGIALGPETLFAKYGFANPMEGISYFANALGEKATQPFAKMMGADDRSKSLTFEPRSGKYINNDTGQYATQAEINAANVGYGSRVSQTPMFDPSMNNFGVAGAPYQTTAGTGGNVLGGTTNNSLPASMGGPQGGGSGSAFQQVLKQQPGKETITRNQFFGTSPEYQAAGGPKLEAEQNTLIRAQVEKQNIQIDQTRKLAEDSAKRDYKIADERAASQEESDAARSAFDKAMNDAKTGTDRQDAGAIIDAINKASGKTGSGSDVEGLKPGDGRKSGQLFDSNVYGKDALGNTIKTGTDVFKEIGNFGFDMFKSAAGQQLTKNIKNPYMQMIANFAINKGLNYGVDALFGKGGFDFGKMFDSGIGSIKDFFTGSSSVTGLDGFDFAGDLLPAADIVDLGGLEFLLAAGGGPVVGPGTGRSDSIPAMLSNGEFVVNAIAAEKYRPLLDALNFQRLSEGTPAASGSVKDMSKVLGTSETNSQLAISNDTLTSIDGSLRAISGRSTGSGTSFTGTGLSFDTGLGSFGGGSVGLSGSSVMGTARRGGSRQAPSTMDYVTAIGGSLLKSYAIKTGVGMLLNAAVPGTTAALAAGFEGGIISGISNAAGMVPNFLSAAGTNISSALGFGGGATTTAVAAGGEMTAAAIGAEAVASGGVAAGAGAAGTGAMASIGAAIPYVLAAVAIFYVVDSIYGGGGGSAPPPKEPKFHAAMYVAGNNNPNAITPMYETLEYHAVPDVYKTIAYGLLRVAFNATKSAEAVTKITPPWDWLYMKVQFDKVSLIWGKGAPSKETIAADTYADNMSWPYSAELNLNSVASDIIDRITKEFKAGLAAENANLAKLDTAAAGLKNYTLDELSSGLISELKTGNLKLDPTKEKGIYASSVAESDRISSLINASASKAAYMSAATSAEYDSEGNETKAASAGGENMVYSIKQGKFVKNPFGLDVILLDHGDRPVYNIEGTSAGLTIDDFVSAERAGTRTANILAPPVTAGSAGAAGATVVNAPSVVTTDASSITQYFQTQQTTIDALRAAQTQTG